MAQPAQHQEEQWFLRTSGDTVFGPVTPEGLVVWAEQGRILPGHEVSADRKRWIPAVSLDFLNMTWYVDDGEGELRGPLHRAAAEALLKSGKVSDQAHLVSATEVDQAESASEKAKLASDKPVALEQKALTQRIQELELQLSERGRNTKSETSTRSVAHLTQERDALAARVTELESFCDTLKRNAEKELRAADKKLETLRGQNKKLEEQLEDLRARLSLTPAEALQPSDQAIVRDLQDKLDTAQNTQAMDLLKLEEFHEQLNAAHGTHEQLREVIAKKEEALQQLQKQLTRLQEDRALCEDKLTDSARKNEELSKHLANVQQEVLRWRDEHALSEKKRQEALSLADAVEQQYSEVRTRIEQMKQDFDRLNLSQEKSADQARKALARATEAERDFADLLAMANARDTEYLEKIAELERFSSQSPDKIAQFYADQTAVYQLFQNELEALSNEQEAEREHLEQLKRMSMKRMDFIQERKQSLTKQLGSSPADMTRLSVREQPSDPAAARIRSEFDNLRFVHERDMRSAEDRERELLRKVRIHETEANRLKSLALEGERSGKQLQELTEQLHRREHELAEERKTREAERAQFLADHQALVSRLEALESEGQTEPPPSSSSEGKTSKLPLWMRLK